MATRTKTVQYAFPITTTTIADATLTNLTQITINLPENSKGFSSVYAELSFGDVISATGGTITEHRVALRLGAAAYSTVTDPGDLTNTGENISGVWGPYDFTSHFLANWTGTSMTCDAQVFFDQTSGTTLGMNNVSVVLYITYTYDDASPTQVKTVMLPLESLASDLPAAAANFGTNQIPQLTGAGGILPEASPVIRDYYFLIEGNDSNAGTTDLIISARIDAGATTTFSTIEAALATGRFMRLLYKPSGGAPDPTAAHNLQLWRNASSFHHVSVTLVVTYEFTLAGTTRILNSVQLPFELPSTGRGTAATDRHRFTRELIITEPGTITLRQSGTRVNYNQAALSGLNVAIGSQAFRAYTDINLVGAGGLCLTQRMDSGSAQGAGLTLARGANAFNIDLYSTNATNDTSNLNGCVYLNYESDVPADGIGAATKTVYRRAFNHQVWGSADFIALGSFGFSILEADYWLMGVASVLYLGQGAAVNALILCCERGDGLGWEDIYADALQTDAEYGVSMVWARARDVFRRCPGDVDPSRLDIETSRTWRFFAAGNVTTLGMIMAVTYHSMTFAAAGTVTGNDAALPTQLKLVRADTDEVIKEQTLAAGTTAFSFTVHDDALDYYIDAYQDATHVGRSALAKAA